MSRHGQPSHDTAQGQHLQHRKTPYDTAISACDTAGGHGHDTAAAPTTRPSVRAPGRSCAHLGVLAGSTGCVLVQFLDSVLFLSHCLETVHEHCSSQNFFETFFLIK